MFSLQPYAFCLVGKYKLNLSQYQQQYQLDLTTHIWGMWLLFGLTYFHVIFWSFNAKKNSLTKKVQYKEFLTNYNIHNSY